MSVRPRLGRWVFGLVAVSGLALVGAPARSIIIVATPNLTLPDGSPGFDLVGQATGAPISPEVLVTLNPQPLPPVPDPSKLSLDLGDPSGPIASNSDDGAEFAVHWCMLAPGGLSFPESIPAPNVDGVTQFEVGGNGGMPLFEVSLRVGPGPFDPASWVMLNPQPLPPKVGAAGFGVEFADPTAVEFHVTEILPTGAPVALQFTLVPEPSTLGSIGLGLAWMACARRSARRGCGRQTHLLV